MKFYFCASGKGFFTYTVMLYCFFLMSMSGMEIKSNNISAILPQIQKDYDFALKYLNTCNNSRKRNEKKINGRVSLLSIVNMINTSFNYAKDFYIDEKNMVRDFYYAFFSLIEIKKIKLLLKKKLLESDVLKRKKDNDIKNSFINFCSDQKERDAFLKNFYNNPFQKRKTREKLFFYYGAQKIDDKIIYKDEPRKNEIKKLIEIRKNNLNSIYKDIVLQAQLLHPIENLEFEENKLETQEELQLKEERKFMQQIFIQKKSQEVQELKKEHLNNLFDSKFMIFPCNIKEQTNEIFWEKRINLDDDVLQFHDMEESGESGF